MTTSNAVTFNVVSDDERTLQQFRRGRTCASRSLASERSTRFLAAATSREDYPTEVGYLPEGATDEQVVALAKKVLKVRKATEYGPLVIAECSAAELPPTLPMPRMRQALPDIRPGRTA